MDTPKRTESTDIDQIDETNYPPVIKRKAKEPKQIEFDIIKQLQDICYNTDPNDIYKDMVKIGQGYIFLTCFIYIYIDSPPFLSPLLVRRVEYL